LTAHQRVSQGKTARFRERNEALTATLLSEADFTAEPVERLDAPEPPTPGERRGHALALVAAVLLHLLIPASFLIVYWFWPPPKVPTEVQEIPVEVVIEQPPPKPKPPQEKPKPPPAPEVEKPAYDAPAAATKDDLNREAPDKTTEAKATPEAPPPPVPGAPPKAESKAPAPEPAEQPKAESTPPAHELAPSPEGELPADANPKEESPAEAAAPAAPPAPAKAPAGTPIPTIEDLPQYKFARSVAHSPIAGGNAESRYFTIIYGMIMAHLHMKPALLESSSRRGMVDFYVDEGGNLVGHRLASSSGSENLDIAVMTAITAAAPYPPPPHWSPVGLSFEFGRGVRPRGEGH
jgi:TonB family protein